MKKRLPNIILILFFLAGLSLLLYPTLSDWWNSMHQTVLIADYTNAVEKINEEEYNRILKEAYAYNDEIFKRGGNNFELSDAEREEYKNLLNISGTGIMGYIEIPVINLKLPIYHTTEDSVLAVGVGHIEGTALPVGGENTHCVISGHRGLPSAKLFTSLDKMKVGDRFRITVLDEMISYEVDQIRIVEPDETEELLTVRGKDYCTLITCTPYGINSHRMLVRGHRVENEIQASVLRITSDAVQIEPLIIALCTAVPMLVVLVIGILIFTGKKKK